MKQHTTKSHDGIELTYAVADAHQDKPWLALIIPFGLKVELAKAFFDFFGPQYNLVVWEARSILDPSDRRVFEGEFSIDNHVADLHTVLMACGAKKYSLIGYCSGAGIALAATNRYPRLFEHLVLVHGEYTMINDKSCTSQFAQEIDSLLSLAAGGEKELKMIFAKVSGDRIEDTSHMPDGIDMPFTKIDYLRRYAANYLSYKAVDFENLARYVTHKCLLMTGKLDVQANVLSTQKIAALMPSAKVHVDENADHYGILREESDTLVTIWNYLYEQRSSYG